MNFNLALDIVTLTDAKATRNAILTAFEEHLIKQAKPGDVVVFHFSRHSSQVLDPDRINSDGLNSTFVTHDSLNVNNGIAVNDIMDRTLFLLMSALQTENVTAVLDSCHAGGGTRGNFVVRSLVDKFKASSEEFEYQRKWLSRLNLSPQELIARRKEGIAKGVVIAGAKSNQMAVDACFDNFYAGAFTYALTQYLWQQSKNEPLDTVMVNVARSVKQIAYNQAVFQELQFEVKPNSDNNKRPIYLVGQQMPPAEAVIVGVDGDRPQVWLGGVNAKSLEAFGKGTVLKVVDPQGKRQGLIELETRDGLKAQGKLLGKATVKPGVLLQEQVRGVPSYITLTIGLDPSLDNEINTARSALQEIEKIEAIPLLQKEVQYIFGRMTEAYRRDFQKQKVANIPPVGSIGLFTPSLEIISNSFDGPTGESVSQAIARLRPKFQSLLAVRLLKLTLNINSSRLNVTASMTRQDGKEVLASISPVRGSIGKSPIGNKPLITLPADASKLPLGTRVLIKAVIGNPSFSRLREASMTCTIQIKLLLLATLVMH